MLSPLWHAIPSDIKPLIFTDNQTASASASSETIFLIINNRPRVQKMNLVQRHKDQDPELQAVMHVNLSHYTVLDGISHYSITHYRHMVSEIKQ